MAGRMNLLSLALMLTLLDGSARALTFTYTQSDNSGDHIALGYPVPLPVDSITPVAGFRSYASLSARLQALADQSEELLAVRLGSTTAGRDIWAYELSAPGTQGDDGEAKGSMLINAGIHAREWSTPEVATGFVERLVVNQDDAGIYQYLAHNLRILVIPVLNVDGFLQTQRYPTQATDDRETPRDGRMRRKNMRGVDEDLLTLNDNLLGIDLNRNNPPYWGNNDSSPDPSSLVYHGTMSASEPEVQALQAAANRLQNSLRFYIDLHSFSQVFIAPSTGNDRLDNLTRSLTSRLRAVTGSRYLAQFGAPGGGIGSTSEYFAERYLVPSYTLETEPGEAGALQYGGLGYSHDGFVLPDNQIDRVRRELGDVLTLAGYRQAGPPALLAVTLSRVADGSVVFDGQWQRQGNVRQLVIAKREALASGIPYRLQLSFDKPMRVRDGQGQVANFTGQNITLKPLINLEGKAADGKTFSISLDTNANGWQQADGRFRSYRDDRYLIDFTLPAGSPVINASLVQMAVTAQDASGQALDADPSSPVTWSGGAWHGYDSAPGTPGDTGGSDRQFRFKDDGSGVFPPPPTPTPTPEPPPSGSGGGGGGGGLGLLGIVTFASLRCGYRRSHNPSAK